MTDLPEAKERYRDYSQWLRETAGLDVDAAQAQVAVTFYHKFQSSEFNKSKNSERIAANKAAKEERSAANAQRRADAEARRKEREETRAAREAERQRKAEEKAARDSERSAADASAPKRGRKSKQTAAEAVAEADGVNETVEFSSEGTKREGSEELQDAAAF